MSSKGRNLTLHTNTLDFKAFVRAVTQPPLDRDELGVLISCFRYVKSEGFVNGSYRIWIRRPIAMDNNPVSEISNDLAGPSNLYVCTVLYVLKSQI